MIDNPRDPFGPRSSSGVPLPIVHLNGTGRHALVQEYYTALRQVRATIAALRECTCHARDYYVHPDPNAYSLAVTARASLLVGLESLKTYLEEHLAAVKTTPRPGPSREAQVDFANVLTGVLREHNATLFYTKDDDGIHVKLDGQEAFDGKGFWNDNDLVEFLNELT